MKKSKPKAGVPQPQHPYDAAAWAAQSRYHPNAPWGGVPATQASKRLRVALGAQNSIKKITDAELIRSFLAARNMCLISYTSIPPFDEIAKLKNYQLDGSRSQSWKAVLWDEAGPPISLFAVAMGTARPPAVDTIADSIIDVANVAVMILKAHFNRARPYQLFPELLDDIPKILASKFPLHPSYPSGHATQAHLLALVLNDITAGAKKNALNALAHSIARNREIAGLHYPSDSKAGEILAHYLHEQLKKLDCYGSVIEAAKPRISDPESTPNCLRSIPPS